MATFENSRVAKMLSSQYPANMRHVSDVDIMLGHRLRRGSNIKSTLVQRVLSAGIILYLGNIELIDIRKPALINDTTRFDYHSSIKTGGSPTDTRRSDYVGCMIRGGGPGVVVSTAAFHARVRGSVPGLGGLKETKMFLPHPRVKVSIMGSLRDREVACSASDRQGSNF